MRTILIAFSMTMSLLAETPAAKNTQPIEPAPLTTTEQFAFQSINKTIDDALKTIDEATKHANEARMFRNRLGQEACETRKIPAESCQIEGGKVFSKAGPAAPPTAAPVPAKKVETEKK